MEPTPFYPAELTSHSRTVLEAVCAAAPGAILIGGWGTWVRTGGPMSHDIDLIVTHDQLGAITRLSADTSESRHLGGRKWRGVVDGIHLDLYVPYRSRLGRVLQLRVEDLARHAEVHDRWTVLGLAAHLASKLAALADRPHTAPGVKDRYEVAALILGGASPADTADVLAQSSGLEAIALGEAMEQCLRHLSDGTLPAEIQRDLRRALQAWRLAFAGRGGNAANPPQDHGAGPDRGPRP